VTHAPIFRRAWMAIILVPLAAASIAAAPPKKKAKRLPPQPAAKPTFDKITCIITGGEVEKRYEATTVDGGKYELRSGRNATPRTGSLTSGQVETLNKQLGKVRWKGVKARYEGPADGAFAALTVTIDGKTHKTTVPIDPALLPDMKSDVPPAVAELVDEMSGIYKRYIGGDRSPTKARPPRRKR
jgi:hypothetical protein